VWAHINRVLWKIEIRSSGMKNRSHWIGNCGWPRWGSRWAKSGHQVVFGSRDPGSGEMKKLVEGGGADGFEAGRFAEVVGGERCGAAGYAVGGGRKRWCRGLRGGWWEKVLIDATNPFVAGPDGGWLYGERQFRSGDGCSGGRRTRGVVKAFNTVGNNIMANPDFWGG